MGLVASDSVRVVKRRQKNTVFRIFVASDMSSWTSEGVRKGAVSVRVRQNCKFQHFAGGLVRGLNGSGYMCSENETKLKLIKCNGLN